MPNRAAPPAVRTRWRPTTRSGIPNRGAWMTQGMGFAGQSGTAGYTADGEIGLAVVTTFLPEAWNANGDYTEASNSASTRVFVELAELLAPGSTTSPQSA